jgi:predicted outer membrane repeat protein
LSGSATVSNNNAREGGGVKVGGGAEFTMSDNASVSGNTARDEGGGGVDVHDNGSKFTLSGSATVSNNNAKKGGGVHVQDNGAEFTLSGSASVSGNTAREGGGGGVIIGEDAKFSKETGSVIYGSDGGDKANTAYDYRGAAITINAQHNRNTTVSSTETLSYDRGSSESGQWADA